MAGGLDYGVGAYKTVTGIHKLYTGEVWNTDVSAKKNVLNLFGWKSVDSLDNTADYIQQAEHYARKGQ